MLQTDAQSSFLLHEGSTLHLLLFVCYNNSLSIRKSFLAVFYNILLSGCTLMYLLRVLLMNVSGVLNFAHADNTE